MNRSVLHGALLAVIDLAMLLVALWISYSFWIWQNPQLEFVVQVVFRELFLPNPWVPPALILIPGWLLANYLTGLYNVAKLEGAAQTASRLTRTAAYMLVLVVAIQFLFTQRYFSRLLSLGFLGSGFTLLLLARVLFIQIQKRLPHPIAIQNVAIFGVGGDALLMAERLETFGRHAYRLVGYIHPTEALTVKVPRELLLGGIGDVPNAVNEHDIHMFVLASRQITREEALKIATWCDHMGLRVLQMPFTWGFASPRLAFASLGELQLIDLQYLSYPTFGENVKRALDLFVVVVGGLLISPLLLTVALAIKLDSAGPVLYTAWRMGKGGRRFPFFKFRSMVVNADAMKDALRAANESDGRLFKIKRDPRITRVGAFIRKWSIDELPQLWNVIRGDMNLVGPRPLPVEDLLGIENDAEAHYWFELRSKVKPGITGLWQVMGRSNLGFKEMVALDIQYVQNWSVWLDLQVLLKTAPAILRARGAS